MNIRVEKKNNGIDVELSLDMVGASWGCWDNYTKNIDVHGLIHQIKEMDFIDDIDHMINHKLSQTITKDWLEDKGLIKNNKDIGYTYTYSKSYDNYSQLLAVDEDGNIKMKEEL